MSIIDSSDLAPYCTGADFTQMDWAAERASALVEAAWVFPVEPAPVWVKAIAETVAVRWLTNPKGLESYTVSVDDASRTERLGTGSQHASMVLTDAERRALGGIRQMRSRVGSIGLSVPGYR